MGADPVRTPWPGRGRGGRGHPGQRVPCRCGRGGQWDSGRARRRWPEPDGHPPSAHRSAAASPRADRPGIWPAAVGTRAAAGQRTAVGPGASSARGRIWNAAQARAGTPGTAVLGRAGRGRLARRSPERGFASTGPVTGRSERWRSSRLGQHGRSGDGRQAPRTADACRRPGAAPARRSGTSAVGRRTPRQQVAAGYGGNAFPRGSVRASTARRAHRPAWRRFGILPGKQARQSHGQPTRQRHGQPTNRRRSQPARQGRSQPTDRPRNQPADRRCSQPARRCRTEPAGRLRSQPADRHDSQPTCRHRNQPADRPRNQPGDRPRNQPVRQRPGEPADGHLGKRTARSPAPAAEHPAAPDAEPLPTQPAGRGFRPFPQRQSAAVPTAPQARYRAWSGRGLAAQRRGGIVPSDTRAGPWRLGQRCARC